GPFCHLLGVDKPGAPLRQRRKAIEPSGPSSCSIEPCDALPGSSAQAAQLAAVRACAALPPSPIKSEQLVLTSWHQAPCCRTPRDK
ncbi:unnamed protein product, partial [Urochloa humidicola]